MTVEAYYRPTSLEEALDLTAEHESSLEVVSGGTITMPAVNEGHTFPSRVMDLRPLGLDYVRAEGETLRLGATTTLSEVIDRSDVPLLREAARHTGGWAVRNMATVGGNLFAPPPLGDFAVALLTLDAEVEIRSRDERRRVPLSEFYRGEDRAIDADELVTEIRVPTLDGETAYLKYTRNQEPAPPIVTVAVRVAVQDGVVDEARIAANGADAHPVRLRDAERVLEDAALDDDAIERAADAAADSANPPRDAVASEWYRRRMIGQYVSKALGEVSEAGGSR
ncbi:FAD binding domain-containing protein [Salinigranum sp. GCM10025319]|uniref:FAD binding domain-containing protein n=1 Tax=Salinigranum sp. GCM10025319 TaxID=3252687 RepID=UPI00361B012B